MNCIPCLGWGSLIWDPHSLLIKMNGMKMAIN